MTYTLAELTTPLTADANAIEARAGFVPGGARTDEFGAQTWIGLAASPADDIRCRENLRSMAGRRDRFICVGKVPHDGQDALIQLQVFRTAAPGNHECVVTVRLYFVPIDMDRKIVSPFFAIGLMPFEIVDGRGHGLSGLLVRAGRIDPMSDHLQDL